MDTTFLPFFESADFRRKQGFWQTEGEKIWLGFTGGQHNNRAEPAKKEDIHQESFHSYIYRHVGALS